MPAGACMLSVFNEIIISIVREERGRCPFTSLGTVVRDVEDNYTVNMHKETLYFYLLLCQLLANCKKIFSNPLVRKVAIKPLITSVSI